MTGGTCANNQGSGREATARGKAKASERQSVDGARGGEQLWRNFPRFMFHRFGPCSSGLRVALTGERERDKERDRERQRQTERESESLQL